MSYVGNTVTTQGFIPAVDYFNGTGSATAFTLSKPVASVAQVQAVISNVVQNPSDAYTVSGNTITFTSAPPTGTNNVYVYYTSPITQVIAPGQGTVTTTSLAAGFTLPVASGGTGGTTSTGTGAVVLATSPTITTPTISQITSATATALTLQSAGTTAITVDTSQNVGIGTTSPIKKFVVSNAGAAGIELDPAASTGVTETIYYNRSTSAYITNRQTALAHQFYAGTSPAYALTVDSSGNLLVGVATTITSKYTVTVSTSATTISSFASDYGQMVIVSGNSSGNIFSDLLFSLPTFLIMSPKLTSISFFVNPSKSTNSLESLV